MGSELIGERGQQGLQGPPGEQGAPGSTGPDHDLLIRIDTKLDSFLSAFKDHVLDDKAAQERTALALEELAERRLKRLELRQAWLMGGGAALAVVWVVLTFFANWFRR